jgi:hypothetical protein
MYVVFDVTSFISNVEGFSVEVLLIKVMDNIFMVCEISSSHGGEYDVQSCLLGYTAV